jgi:TolB-like protein/lipoprotein NlpI
MSDIIEGYTYDIFISYRQKDNKYDGWVTEFVNNLKRELEATFKEEISVYFDINPQDCLLENHDVDASLKEKLKCLIFIPIISRTYCDPKSFAWEHEFRAFVEQASDDQFGLKIKLPDGNVASRVLPVRIHDLDNTDINECEAVLGGALRGINFIYNEPGVNRPLTPYDDEKTNINKARYRNQINKVALATKEIISGLKKEPGGIVSGRKENLFIEEKLLLREKSIIVLPFENISPEPEQDFFSDGLTEEIITDLSHINDLLVISRGSAMTFKGTGDTLKEIAEKVNVRYVLEGSVRKAGNDLRITAQLIDGRTDTHIWAEKYEETLDNVFRVQEKISRMITDSLQIKLSDQEQNKLRDHSAGDLVASECWFRAKQEIQHYTPESFERANAILEAGLKENKDSELLLWGLGYLNWFYVNMGIHLNDVYLQKAEDYVGRIFNINRESSSGYHLQGLIAYKRGDTKKSIYYTKKALEIEPNNPEALDHLIWMYADTGKTLKSQGLIERLLVIDPLTSHNHWAKGFTLLTEGRFEESLPAFKRAYDLDPENIVWKVFYAYAVLMDHKTEAALEIITPLEESRVDDLFVYIIIFIKNAFLRDHTKTLQSLKDELIKLAEWDEICSLWLAQSFAMIGENEKALNWIEYAVLNRGFINYPFLAEYDHTLENIRDEKRFKRLMEKVKSEYENFDG